MKFSTRINVYLIKCTEIKSIVGSDLQMNVGHVTHTRIKIKNISMTLECSATLLYHSISPKPKVTTIVTFITIDQFCLL